MGPQCKPKVCNNTKKHPMLFAHTKMSMKGSALGVRASCTARPRTAGLMTAVRFSAVKSRTVTCAGRTYDCKQSNQRAAEAEWVPARGWLLYNKNCTWNEAMPQQARNLPGGWVCWVLSPIKKLCALYLHSSNPICRDSICVEATICSATVDKKMNPVQLVKLGQVRAQGTM